MADFTFILQSPDVSVLDDALADMTAFFLKQKETSVHMEILPADKTTPQRLHRRKYTVQSYDIHIQRKIQRYDMPAGIFVTAV